MQISVIIPSYKPQEYICKCIGSLNDQTLDHKEFEIVIVLNGCRSPFYERIVEQKKLYPDLNIHLIQTDQGGVSNARNIGIDNSTGKFLCFIDDDDYVSDTYLQELLNKANKDTVSLARPIAFRDSDAQCLKYRIENEFYRCSKKKNSSIVHAKKFFAGPCMKLIHRDIISNRRFNLNFKTGEDSLFMFLISDGIKHVSFTSENAIYYRRYRDGSATLTRKSRKETVKNSYLTLCEYFHIFKIGRYDTVFFITRVLAEMKCLIVDLLGIKR